MQHSFFFDGNSKRIAWIIKNRDSEISQKREHVEMYLDKVNSLQSKYISLHVGLFWGIGRFIIKNGDQVSVKINEQKMLDHLSGKSETSDEFIKTRTNFIKKFIKQRKLEIDFEKINVKDNLSSRLI